ncbi:GNAT family N-acetyltransferase [Mesoflavibacter zeaxanthinifaciens]|uniref:GNAT family N-acetyltransferase n=1 Tax=Mesoflavibacter zeaxanthinifaciens TaxID=393060 RepID=UPI003A92B8A7
MELILKPFNVYDWKNLEKWVSNELELIQFAGTIFSFPVDQKQVENYLLDSNREVFRVETRNNQIIGMAEMSLEANNVAKLSRVLIGENTIRGKGIGTELIKKMITYAFEKPEVNRIVLNVYSWNIGAIKCYKKVGFYQSDKPMTDIWVGNDRWKIIEMEIRRDDFCNKNFDKKIYTEGFNNKK